MTKTITISDETWQKLAYMKIELKKRNLTDVLETLIQNQKTKTKGGVKK